MGKKVLLEKNHRQFFIHISSHLYAQSNSSYPHKLQSLSTKIKSFPPFSEGYTQPLVQKDFREKQEGSSPNAVTKVAEKNMFNSPFL
jgi:hypothetical protein